MSQWEAYAAAHFNLVSTGNVVHWACQFDPSKPGNITKNFTTTDVFECIAANIPKVTLGLCTVCMPVDAYYLATMYLLCNRHWYMICTNYANATVIGI